MQRCGKPLKFLALLLLCAPAWGQQVTIDGVPHLVSLDDHDLEVVDIREPLPPVIDYSNGDQLSGVEGVIDGTVQYHMQWPGGSYTREHLGNHIKATPDGGFILWDTEPWTHKVEGDYWTGDEARNLALFRAYAETLWHFAPELKARRITVHVYQAPVMLSRNYTVIRRPPGHPHYEAWEAEQLKVLWQAESSGMLPALRAINGGVALPCYVPTSWVDGKKWGDNLEQLATNLDTLLDAQNVPHVWLMRPDCAGKPLAAEHLKVFLATPARNRLAVWGTPEVTGFPELTAGLAAMRPERPKTEPKPATQADIDAAIERAIKRLKVTTE